ncbi:hypothetical protein C8J57DRAFT_1519726 [Mycena rebaudengoi]|nr:hypothetical protein C8J57DRAFT_1519726 [Mycena rebaudengoi]
MVYPASTQAVTGAATQCVQVGLESISNTPVQLIMRTSNNHIESSISLLTPQGAHGKFGVSATTSNGRLNIDFPASPPDSTLDLTAGTSNAAASVTLHEAYEGVFALDTSNAKLSLRCLNPDEKEHVVCTVRCIIGRRIMRTEGMCK